jgi:hypothetical protein
LTKIWLQKYIRVWIIFNMNGFSPLFSVLSLLTALSGSKRHFADVVILSGRKQIALKAEVADSWIKKTIGLMGRKGLGEREGMLFVFGREGRLKFWMRNMLMPLDMIFISGDWRVADFVENAEPCGKLLCRSYKPEVPARYALEVRAGFVKKYGIGKGDRVVVKLQI